MISFQRDPLNLSKLGQEAGGTMGCVPRGSLKNIKAQGKTHKDLWPDTGTYRGVCAFTDRISENQATLCEQVYFLGYIEHSMILKKTNKIPKEYML